MRSRCDSRILLALAIFAQIATMATACRSRADLSALHTAQLSANWLRAAQFSLSLDDTLYCIDTTYRAPCHDNLRHYPSPIGDHHTPLRPVAVRRSHVVATASDTTQAQASSEERIRERTLRHDSFPSHDAIALVFVVLLIIFAAVKFRK